MNIQDAFLCRSEYRENDFNIDNKVNSRWLLVLRVVDENMDHDYPEDAPHYDYCYLNFTAYNLKEETEKEAYKFFIKHMHILIECYKLDSPLATLNDYTRDPFFDAEYKDCLNSEGFALFLSKFCTSPALYGQPIAKLINELTAKSYIYYSSLKLLSYGYNGNSGEAFDTYSDMLEFLDNPPPITTDKPPKYQYYSL